MLVGRQAEPGARGVGELRPALAVGLRRALHLRNPLPDDGLGDDELRPARLRPLGALDRLEHGRQIVAVGQRLHIPADRLEARGRVLALRLRRHRVQGDVVRVVDEDEVVQSLVTGEFDRLHADAFLHAAVAGEADDVVVEDRVLGRVEPGGRHLPGHRHADGIAHALAQRTGGALDAGGDAKLRMAGGLAVELAEILQFLERQIVAAQMQPAVEEHAAMARGQDEAVAVEPAGLVRDCAPGRGRRARRRSRRPERQAEMAGGGLVDGVDGQPARLGAGPGEDFCVKLHGKMLTNIRFIARRMQTGECVGLTVRAAQWKAQIWGTTGTVRADPFSTAIAGFHL